jgi:hypothetical protein
LGREFGEGRSVAHSHFNLLVESVWERDRALDFLVVTGCLWWCSTDKGMKLEWATVKDDALYLGSFGKEFTAPGTPDTLSLIHTDQCAIWTIPLEHVSVGIWLRRPVARSHAMQDS